MSQEPTHTHSHTVMFGQCDTPAGPHIHAHTHWHSTGLPQIPHVVPVAICLARSGKHCDDSSCGTRTLYHKECGYWMVESSRSGALRCGPCTTWKRNTVNRVERRYAVKDRDCEVITVNGVAWPVPAKLRSKHTKSSDLTVVSALLP